MEYVWKLMRSVLLQILVLPLLISNDEEVVAVISKDNSSNDFPTNFLFGTSSSSYQVLSIFLSISLIGLNMFMLKILFSFSFFTSFFFFFALANSMKEHTWLMAKD